MVAPSEPTALKSLGRVSPFCERVGADVTFIQKGKIFGVQRKTLGDLVSSLGDRLTREVILLNQKVDVGLLVIEGKVATTRDGNYVSEYGQPFSKEQLRRLIYSVQSSGIWVIQTDSIEETIVAILDLHAWAQKDEHKSLVTRSGPKNPWHNKLSKRDMDAFVLQSFEGIGPVMARRIVDHFDGLPLVFKFTEEELAAIEGIGPVRARNLMRHLPIDPGMVVVADSEVMGKRQSSRKVS